jgi:hypothetical protein
MVTASGLSCWPDFQNIGIKQSILSSLTLSCVGIGIYSACIGVIYRGTGRIKTEFHLKQFTFSAK